MIKFTCLLTNLAFVLAAQSSRPREWQIISKSFRVTGGRMFNSVSFCSKQPRCDGSLNLFTLLQLKLRVVGVSSQRKFSRVLSTYTDSFASCIRITALSQLSAAIRAVMRNL